MPGVVNWVKSIWQHFLGCCSLFPDHQHGRVSALDFGSLSSSDSALTTRTAALTSCFISLRCIRLCSSPVVSQSSLAPLFPCVVFVYSLVSSSIAHHPFFLSQSLSLNTELSDWPGWPAREPQGSPCLLPPRFSPHPHLTSKVLMCTERPLLAEPSP